jgi:hypothetical protein
MKNLLVNGCSFVAGYSIVWDNFVQENNRQGLAWLSLDYHSNEEHAKLLADYKDNYRKKYNFPTILAKELGVEHIDLSEDGASNDSIAMSTLLFLLSLPEEDRRNYHVVIGWTSLTRIAKYCKIWKTSMNLHLNELKSFSKKPDVFKEVQLHHQALINSHDEDYFSNYIKNIFLLENFLKANGVTYTFYRNIGEPGDCSKHKFESFFHSLSMRNVTIDINNFTNNDHWFKFISSEYIGFDIESLQTVYITGRPYNQIDYHPNLNVIQEVSKRISLFIKEKNYLNIL